jgi:hypothetical protein
MEIIIASVAAVVAAVAAAKALEQQKNSEEEGRVKIPIRVEEEQPKRKRQ